MHDFSDRTAPNFTHRTILNKMDLPIQTVRAAVSVKSHHSFQYPPFIVNLWHHSRLQTLVRNLFLTFALILLIILVFEAFLALWIWQLPPDRFQRFTSCLDAGVVPSWKERLIFHLACFWGSL